MSDSQKQEAIKFIEALPDNVTTQDIIEELFFKQKVDEGLRDVAEGRTISHEELKARMAQWRKSAGR